MRSIVQVVILIFTVGCQYSHRPNVIVATGTVIGVDIGESVRSGLPSLKLGYNRGEVIYATPHNGTVPPVVAELSYGGIKRLSSGGVYQRVAMGSAVESPAVKAMFSDMNVIDDYRSKLDYVRYFNNVSSPGERERLTKIAKDNGFEDFNDYVIETDIEEVTKSVGEL